MRLTITGHRPYPKLGGYDPTAPLNQAVIKAMEDRLLGLRMAHPGLICCSGMALGTDQWFADLCNRHNIPWIAFLPCVEQWSKWPTSSKEEWARILKGTKEIRQVTGVRYTPRCMQLRNEAMIDWAAEDEERLCLAVWDATSGGTANCVRYARQKGLTVDVINPTTLEV